jgi:hypothetical protein
VTKFVAFLLTASLSMLAESVHSLADTSNQALLLLGGKRAKRAATPEHPFGYGRERPGDGTLLDVEPAARLLPHPTSSRHAPEIQQTVAAALQQLQEAKAAGDFAAEGQALAVLDAATRRFQELTAGSATRWLTCQARGCTPGRSPVLPSTQRSRT